MHASTIGETIASVHLVFGAPVRIINAITASADEFVYDRSILYAEVHIHVVLNGQQLDATDSTRIRDILPATLRHLDAVRITTAKGALATLPAISSVLCAVQCHRLPSLQINIDAFHERPLVQRKRPRSTTWLHDDEIIPCSPDDEEDDLPIPAYPPFECHLLVNRCFECDPNAPTDPLTQFLDACVCHDGACNGPFLVRLRSYTFEGFRKVMDDNGLSVYIMKLTTLYDQYGNLKGNGEVEVRHMALRIVKRSDDCRVFIGTFRSALEAFQATHLPRARF